MGVLDGDSPIIAPLPLFIVQLLLITILSRGLGKLFKYVNQPLVVAGSLVYLVFSYLYICRDGSAKIGGILLGPSAFGLIPKFKEIIFPTDKMVVLQVMANFGLILFMFLVGLEVEYDVLTSTLKKFAIISTIGVVVPFALSIPVAYLIYTPEYAGPDASLGNFILFTGIAMGTSALPVLARMLAERGMLKQRLGVVTMSATAIDDLEGWILLAIVVSIARASSSLNVLWTILMAVGNVLLLIFVVRPIFNRIAKIIDDRHYVSASMFFIILVVLLIFSWITDMIGISAIFGAFEVGCVVPRNGKLVNELFTKLKDIIAVIFLPLYFTFSGLRTQFGLLNTAEAWGIFVLIFVVQFISKMLGSGLSGKYIGGLNNRESFCFGILMQTKGLVALITFNLGLDYKVITPKFFAVNVMMVLISTIVTSPLVEFIYPAKKMREASLLSKGKKDSIFSILLCCSTTKNARSLVSVSEHLISANKLADDFSAHVTALNIVEDNGEASNYLWTWFNEKKSQWNAILRAARERAKAIGFKIDPQAVVLAGNPDIGHEISLVSHNKGAHLVLMGCKALTGEEIPSQVNPAKNPVVHHVLKHVEADVGVLIDKKTFRKRATKILCPLLGTSNDAAAVKYAEKIAQGEGVQVLLVNIVNPAVKKNVDEENQLIAICTANSSMKYVAISSNDPFEAVMDLIKSKQNDYSLVILGDHATDSAGYFYINCPVSLLVMYANEEEDAHTSRASHTISPDSDEEDNNATKLTEIQIQDKGEDSE